MERNGSLLVEQIDRHMCSSVACVRNVLQMLQVCFECATSVTGVFPLILRYTCVIPTLHICYKCCAGRYQVTKRGAGMEDLLLNNVCVCVCVCVFVCVCLGREGCNM
jgi:hypothetical protein